MSHNSEKRRSKIQTYYKLIRGLAVIAAAFSLVVCVLMIANYFQTKAIDPLNSPALQKLIAKLDANPNDTALREEIRALDLLARKAYFTSLWQLRMGGYFLLWGIIILLIALKTLSSLRQKLPNPKEFDEKEDFWKLNTLTRNAIAIGGVAILGLALILGILSHSELSADNPFETATDFFPIEELEKHWTNFRGPGGNGHAHYTHAPTSWNGETGEGILWKVPVPKPGYSSPVVWENRIFLTGGDKQAREVYCFDAKSGKMLWQKPVINIPGSTGAVTVDEGTGFAAPTTATDGKRVCAIFPTGDLICFDRAGNQLWGYNLGVPDNHYGHASSLIIYQDLLFVQYDQNKNSKLLALQTATGKTIWEVKRGAISWSSPICVNTGSRMELILTNSRSVDSYDPKTGEKLWNQNCLGGEVGPSAAYADGMVFAANEYAQGVGIRINPSNAASSSEIVWTYDDALPNTSSPVATAEYVFLATSDGLVSCLDAKKGTLLWEQEFDDGFYASPIIVDNRVYALDLKGVMHIFKLDKAYESLGEPKLGEDSSCTPAFLDGRIYVRGEKHLYCIVSD